MVERMALATATDVPVTFFFIQKPVAFDTPVLDNLTTRKKFLIVSAIYFLYLKNNFAMPLTKNLFSITSFPVLINNTSYKFCLHLFS
jgi:hypothetical protein